MHGRPLNGGSTVYRMRASIARLTHLHCLCMTMTKQQVLKLEISTEIYLLILILKVNNIIRFHNEAWRKLVSLLSVIILQQFQYPQRDTQILISIESIRCRHSLKRLSGHISDIPYLFE